MKIQLFSDLHFESQAAFDLPETDAELIVLAGDIDEGLAGIRWAIRQAERLGKPVLYVFGNHEYHRQSLPGIMTEARILTLGTPVHILERNCFTLGDTRFLGCTLWSDFQFFGPEQVQQCLDYARHNMPDYRTVTKQNGELLQPEDTLWLFGQSVAWLQRELHRPWPGKTVIVTHHAPSQLATDPERRTENLTAAFVSHLEHLTTYHRVDVWIHGHTHFNVDLALGKTRLLSHQLGRRGDEHRCAQFSRKQVFVL